MASRTTTLIASATIVVALVAGVALYLRSTQASARDKLLDDFAQRVALMANVTSSAIVARNDDNRAYAEQQFGGRRADLQAAVDADAEAEPQERIIVSRNDGTVLASHPHALRDDLPVLPKSPELARAMKGQVGFSNILRSAGGPIIMLAVPFATKYGARIWSSSISVDVLSGLANGYLSVAPGVAGTHAYLLDGNGAVLAASTDARQGADLGDRRLKRTARVGSGVIGDDYYTSAAVAKTPWRILFVVPKRALLQPIQSTRRVAWQVFGAFAAAMLCLLGLGARALSRSSRLAHERLHDSLTGLPNRALFLERTEAALARLARRGAYLATLFIDLDRFKAINDAYGHAVGDALLVAVAQRLRESIRHADRLSRFGGDEFLILCPELEDEDQPRKIAARVQEVISRPFDIAGHQLSIGCSIGIAVHYVQGSQIDAATLVHNADLAMYRAKHSSRSRIETFKAASVAAA